MPAPRATTLAAIKVYALRRYKDPKGNYRVRHVFMNVTFDEPEQVFNQELVNRKISRIPTADRYNLYFTVAHCHLNLERDLESQWMIPIDLDDLEGQTAEEVKANAEKAARAACRALGLVYEHTGVIFSGNGVQLFILMDSPINSDKYFKKASRAYKNMTKVIGIELAKDGIKAKLDTSVWSPGRLMRLPGTLNKKQGKEERLTEVLSPGLEEIAFNLMNYSDEKEDNSEKAHISYGVPDTQGVLEECGFLQFVQNEPEKVDEPQWYAALSIIARLDNGTQISHDISSAYSGYNFEETQMKVEQALEQAGPRTCANIYQIWDKCSSCPHFKQITSPIQIKGENFIASENFGYRQQIVGDNGQIKSGRIVYSDIIKKFRQTFLYKVEARTEEIWIYNGKYWEPMPRLSVKNWLGNKIKDASSAEMSEFLDRILALGNIFRIEDFDLASANKINLKNCVVDLLSKETVHKHSPDYGFTYCMDYEWNPYAQTPTWDRFLKDFTCNDVSAIRFLEEYGGYCISGDVCWLEACLILIGEGNNGKTVFADTLKEIAGPKNVSSVPVQRLKTPVDAHLLVNKLFNVSDETHETALMDAEFLKSVITGGTYQVKKLYKDMYEVKNKTKFLILSNHRPVVQDRSAGFFRRLIMYNIKFKLEQDDPRLDRRIRDKLKDESSGILYKLVQGYIRLKERGHFEVPETLQEFKKEFKQESDPFSDFMMEECIVGENPNDFTIAADLYSAFKAWAIANGQPIFGMSKISHYATKHGCVRAEKHYGKSRKVIFRNVRLVNAASSSQEHEI